MKPQAKLKDTKPAVVLPQADLIEEWFSGKMTEKLRDAGAQNAVCYERYVVYNIRPGS
jgi:hypothetical protein